MLARRRIKALVRREQLLVSLASARVRRHGRAGDGPVCVGWDGPRPDRRQQRVAVTGADGLLRHHLRTAGAVGHDLRPQTALGAATDSDDPSGWTRDVGHEVEHLAHGEAGLLADGAQQVPATVAQRQPRHHPARVRVEDRGPLAGEVRRHEQSVRTWRGCLGLEHELREGHIPRQPAQPLGDAPGRRQSCRKRQRSASQAGRRPQSLVDGHRLERLDEEHRRPVHEHQVARLAYTDAERLRPGVDAARDDRRPGRQAGLGRRRGRHGADHLVAPAESRQRHAREDVVRPRPDPVGAGASRRGGRTAKRCGGRARRRR